MIDDPLALNTSFYSVVIKAAAVIRCFPGGIAGLDAQFGIVRRTKALLVLVCMSSSDAEFILDNLERAGLQSGEDVGLCDMTQGVLIPCQGIVFEEAGDQPMPRWTATWMPVWE